MSVVRAFTFPFGVLSYALSIIFGFLAIVMKGASNKFLLDGNNLTGWRVG